jgi:hypothetical protein
MSASLRGRPRFSTFLEGMMRTIIFSCVFTAALLVGSVSRADTNLVGLTLNVDGPGCGAANACEPWGNCWYVSLGAVCKFTATGSYDDGSIQDVTASAAWASAYPSIAMSGNIGHTKQLGDTTITASVGSVSASQDVFVGF